MMNNDGKILRLRYYQGQLLTKEDFEAQQAYHIEKLSQFLRRFPFGIVSGFEIEIVMNADNVEGIRIQEGLAIDRFGNYIIVPEGGVYLELNDFTDDVAGGNDYLSLQYYEQKVLEDGSACSAPQTCNRILETFTIHWDNRPNIYIPPTNGEPGVSKITLAQIEIRSPTEVNIITDFDHLHRIIRLDALILNESRIQFSSKEGHNHTGKGKGTPIGPGGIARHAVEADNIAENAVVKSLNSLKDSVTLVGTGAITIQKIEQLKILKIHSAYDGYSLDSKDEGPADRVYVNEAGVVGIATTSPTAVENYTLDVNGNVAIRGEDSTATPDPGYALDVNGNVKIRGELNIGQSLSFVELSVEERLEVLGSLYAATDGLGKVGIGTAAPDTLLHIRGTSDVDPTLKLQARVAGSNPGKISLRKANEDGVDIYYKQEGGINGLRFETVAAGTANGVKMILAADGKVGIGTGQPGELLHLSSNSNPVFLINSRNSAENAGKISFRQKDNDGFDLRASGQSFRIEAVTGGSPGSAGLTVAQDGKVGISNESPEATLDVKGAIKSSTEAGTILYHHTNESGIPDSDGFRLRYDHNFFATNADALIIEKTDENDPIPDGGIAFVNTGNSGTVVPSLVIRGSGKVGIGKIDPAESLDVKGILQTERIKIPAGAANGRVLTSDEYGEGTWQDNSNLIASSFQMAPNAVEGYVLTSDSSGNGTWRKLAEDIAEDAVAVSIGGGITIDVGSGEPFFIPHTEYQVFDHPDGEDWEPDLSKPMVGYVIPESGSEELALTCQLGIKRLAGNRYQLGFAVTNHSETSASYTLKLLILNLPKPS
ncbi:MAG: hypothetical protein KDH97_00120 [Calditrichaeota bacterium]|nr:hypothetical protein [Calditrichota bacterium]MCB9088587.1 hypothetical protein [Calditrichia bacterium]MCB0288639.1 hypothetical protein [Calditrichota bacterium]MCB0294132.1 hypothetical protein [Calditrichota bacterium]MCB0302437.1 hypothetical protein [Calditrichota bacterium]